LTEPYWEWQSQWLLMQSNKQSML